MQDFVPNIGDASAVLEEEGAMPFLCLCCWSVRMITKSVQSVFVGAKPEGSSLLFLGHSGCDQFGFSTIGYP